MKRLILAFALVTMVSAVFAQNYVRPALVIGNGDRALGEQIETMLCDSIDLVALGLEVGKEFVCHTTFSVTALGNVENLQFGHSDNDTDFRSERAAKIRAAIREQLEKSQWVAGTKDGAPQTFQISVELNLISRQRE